MAKTPNPPSPQPIQPPPPATVHQVEDGEYKKIAKSWLFWSKAFAAISGIVLAVAGYAAYQIRELSERFGELKNLPIEVRDIRTVLNDSRENWAKIDGLPKRFDDVDNELRKSAGDIALIKQLRDDAAATRKTADSTHVEVLQISTSIKSHEDRLSKLEKDVASVSDGVHQLMARPAPNQTGGTITMAIQLAFKEKPQISSQDNGTLLRYTFAPNDRVLSKLAAPRVASIDLDIPTELATELASMNLSVSAETVSGNGKYAIVISVWLSQKAEDFMDLASRISASVVLADQ